VKRAAFLIAVAFAVSGCTYGNWGHIGTGGGGPRAPVQRDVEIDSPRLSPDGTTILFAFRYKNFPWKIAMIPSDPAATRLTVLKFPPMDHWLQPNMGPDGKTLAVLSYCTHEQCYEGAKGYHVWLATPQPNGALKRVSPDVPNVRRERPMFGATTDDLYWIVSDATKYPGVHLDVANRFVARMADGKETVLFPQTGPGGDITKAHLDDVDLNIISAHGAGRFDERGYYFAGMVAGGKSEAATAAIDKIEKFHTALFRYAGGRFELVEPVEIEYVDAPRGDRGYVAMAHHFTKEHTNAVADFRAVQNGRTLWSFRFHSQAYDLSASDDLGMVVFNGERSYIDEKHIWHPKLQKAIFLWRQGMSEAVDLNVPERLKAQVEKEIEAEHAAKTSALPPFDKPARMVDTSAAANPHFAGLE
jgi:hypothetical protein